eukprot:TRINITY_DN8799_c0_g1_i2.p1 TRINITY_DN8799_c0_g1~~TRINITY_DN8799_c0_g1_i2.p1  ORF type:complete len:153 (-),score=11.34 TRINITY_DN8799_c0_g1_i2:708-1166(-)
MEHYYVKEYIPGYTGHVPEKMGTFAMTVGEINRQLVLSSKAASSAPLEKQYYTRCITHLRGSGDRDKYGYRSRHGLSWIAGPTNQVYAQHIPRNSPFQSSVPRIYPFHCSREYQGQIICSMLQIGHRTQKARNILACSTARQKVCDNIYQRI